MSTYTLQDVSTSSALLMAKCRTAFAAALNFLCRTYYVRWVYEASWSNSRLLREGKSHVQRRRRRHHVSTLPKRSTPASCRFWCIGHILLELMNQRCFYSYMKVNSRWQTSTCRLSSSPQITPASARNACPRASDEDSISTFNLKQCFMYLLSSVSAWAVCAWASSKQSFRSRNRQTRVCLAEQKCEGIV